MITHRRNDPAVDRPGHPGHPDWSTRSIFPRTILAVLLAVQALIPVDSGAQTLANQATDPTVLKQIIIFGRHSVRSSTVSDAILAQTATRPYPAFEVQPGYLTPHGRQAATLLGTYFRTYLTAEGLLTGFDAHDAGKAYVRSNSIQRSNVTAAAFAEGLLPAASVPVHSYPLGQADPVFDPIAANVAPFDVARAVKEVSGVYNGAALPAALGGEYALVRSVLFNYPNGTYPVPPVPAGLVDPTALPVPLTASTAAPSTGGIVNLGGLARMLYATDPFIMQYTDGMPLKDVAWGELSVNELSQQTRIITTAFAIELTTPYLAQVQSSNAAAHVLRTMEQAVSGRMVRGAFRAQPTNVAVVISSDAYVVGLAALLQMHWMLPGYQPDFAAPGGALVFELRQVRSTGEHVVRAYYTAQTMDQLRYLIPLTATQPPATMQLLIPGGDQADGSLDVRFSKFRALVNNAINHYYVQDPAKETPPGPLTGVPLK